jgi:hypothetical protein
MRWEKLRYPNKEQWKAVLADFEREQQRQRKRHRTQAVTGPSSPGIAKMAAYLVEMHVVSVG